MKRAKPGLSSCSPSAASSDVNALARQPRPDAFRELARRGVAQLDLLEAHVAAEQLRIVCDVVSVRWPQTAYRDHDDLHGCDTNRR